MPLSEEELRLLEQMERALVEEDPKLASRLRGTSFRRAARRRMVIGGFVLALGVAALVAAVLLSEPVLGVVGFVIMLGGAVLAITTSHSPAAHHGSDVRATGHGGFGVVDGGRRHRPRRPRQQRHSGSFMERMEERWRQRRQRGF